MFKNQIKIQTNHCCVLSVRNHIQDIKLVQKQTKAEYLPGLLSTLHCTTASRHNCTYMYMYDTCIKLNELTNE